MVKKSLAAIGNLVDDESAHPIDKHVGERIRLRRKMLRLTQTDLAELLGISFQQVQKYERGSNRIGCSRLYELSLILQTPIDFFFQDITGDIKKLFVDLIPKKASGMADNSSAEDGDTSAESTMTSDESFAKDPFKRKDVLELIVAYNKINDDEQKKLFLDLAKNFTKK
ncbi:MAG: helix-turn-helix transcriptional regulator [Hydrotalea sp.]|nr:helix-turn-helix transcriptional regulator [Hydrotalea sp.]